MYPCNEEVHWEADFYKIAWSNLDHPMTVMFMVHGHVVGDADPSILGYVLHKLCFDDGKIRIDNFEYNLLNPPIKWDDSGSRSKEIINFTI